MPTYNDSQCGTVLSPPQICLQLQIVSQRANETFSSWSVIVSFHRRLYTVYGITSWVESMFSLYLSDLVSTTINKCFGCVQQNKVLLRRVFLYFIHSLDWVSQYKELNLSPFVLIMALWERFWEFCRYVGTGTVQYWLYKTDAISRFICTELLFDWPERS